MCDSAKCGMVRKPYPPGQHGKNIRRRLSEYGVQQAEKQKLKLIYGLREKQFKKYFETASKKKGITPQIMMDFLERRLDNVIFRSGLAPTRRAARQLVVHGHILVNSKKVRSPSYSVRVGELIDIKESSKAKKTFADARTILKKFNPPRWLDLDKEKLSAKVMTRPDKEFLDALPVEVSKVLEYYSR